VCRCFTTFGAYELAAYFAQRIDRSSFPPLLPRRYEWELGVKMLEIDSAAAHYQIDAQRIDLVEEFRRAPGGPHSDELQRVLPV
jgi:hypothetical protein